MRRTWIYERGRWVETRDPFQEFFEDFDEELGRLGFESASYLRFGDENRFHVEVYEAGDSVTVQAIEGPVEVEFLVTINLSSDWHRVFVVDLPSLVQLVGELRPMLASAREVLDFEEFEERQKGR